jgi:hypothetical protein
MMIKTSVTFKFVLALNVADCYVMQYKHQRLSSHLLHSLLMSLYNHYYSYDMYIRPTVLFDLPPVTDPDNELLPSEFYELSGFWPGQFIEIVDHLILSSEIIICPTTSCTAFRQVSIFLMLQCWKKADKWEDFCHVMRRGNI